MSERQVEWAGVRMPQASSISRLARNSCERLLVAAGRGAHARAGLAGADASAAGHRVLLEAEVVPEPLGALDVVLDQADLDLRRAPPGGP